MVDTKEKQLRKWEYLEDRRCMICKKPFIAKIYWAYGGTNLLGDHWVVSSVYCSTKCSEKGHKMFLESDNPKKHKKIIKIRGKSQRRNLCIDKMKKADKKDFEIFKKNKEIIIEIFAKIVNGEKFSEKEVKKIGKARTELKFATLMPDKTPSQKECKR